VTEKKDEDKQAPSFIAMAALAIGVLALMNRK
jgi:hypothetical protein